MGAEDKSVLDIIALFDENGDGVLTGDELMAGLLKHGMVQGTDHANVLIRHFDRDNSGTIIDLHNEKLIL